MLSTFVYGYPYQHLQKQVWQQISNLPNNKGQPWIILGDLIELSKTYEKVQPVMVVARDIIYSIILVIPILLLIPVLCIILLHGIININENSIYSGIDSV